MHGRVGADPPQGRSHRLRGARRTRLARAVRTRHPNTCREIFGGQNTSFELTPAYCPQYCALEERFTPRSQLRLSRATCRVCATFHPACELSNSNHHHRFLSSVSSRLPRTPNHFLADARYASRNPRGRPPRKNTSSCKLSPIRVNRSTQTARARFGRPCAAHLLGRLRSSKALGSTVRASRGFDVWPSAGPLSTISAETLPTTTPASITFLELHQRNVSLV